MIEANEEYEVVGSKVVKSGAMFRPELKVSCIPTEWFQNRNFAAKNALEIEEYTISDGPFWYGKVEGFGYILAEKNLLHEKPISSEGGE